MRLPIVDTRTIPEEFDYLRAWGVGETLPVRGRLDVRRVVEGLRARVEVPGDEPRHVLLDAEFAGELASAARLLAGRDEGTAYPLRPRDWQTIVEVGWNGVTRWFALEQEPVEDALRAVVRRMDSLLTGDVEFHAHEIRGR
jgi:hypothetical protein